MKFSIRENDILLVDLDNTLVFTDEANNVAYIEAIRYYLPNFEFDYSERITREHLPNILNCFSDDRLISNVVALKEMIYEKHLFRTLLNEEVYCCIKNHNPELCYLITNAKIERVNSILNYYGMKSNFKNIFSIKYNKYREVFKIPFFFLNREKIFVFEDSVNEIMYLKNVLGIHNVYMV
ncbi:hypothetical protein [Avibacterium avium]|uniref:hypothetical protein n=1 Tax=Avibacterium avium TaxID=751 RepID=UPI003BF7F5DF